eukprot:4741682-Pleurochrysis_carterae.AAC.1
MSNTASTRQLLYSSDFTAEYVLNICVGPCQRTQDARNCARTRTASSAVAAAAHAQGRTRSRQHKSRSEYDTHLCLPIAYMQIVVCKKHGRTANIPI